MSDERKERRVKIGDLPQAEEELTAEEASESAGRCHARPRLRQQNHLRFYHGHYGPQATYADHSFIQRLLEGEGFPG
jgi:hypothetical protein